MSRRKHCWRCNETLPLDSFHVNRAAPDGHTATCASCDKLRRLGLPSAYQTERRRELEEALKGIALSVGMALDVGAVEGESFRVLCHHIRAVFEAKGFEIKSRAYPEKDCVRVQIEGYL